jgi:hypothetical protein
LANPSLGTGYFWIRSSPSTYANGQRVTSTDSGGSWTADVTRDFNFKAYMQTGFDASGNLVSGLKDANPTPGFNPTWSTISWTATVPANTSVQFQVAGSNNPNGPFTFVGPDNTAGTFFTASGASLTPQFNGMRYMKYKAYLATTDSTQTPTLNGVTLCFNNLAPTAAGVTVSGRVLTGDGRGVVNARVTITDSNGAVRTVITSPFGYYRFDDVQAGGTYVMGVISKRFKYASRVVSVTDNLADVDFTAGTTAPAPAAKIKPGSGGVNSGPARDTGKVTISTLTLSCTNPISKWATGILAPIADCVAVSAKGSDMIR